jgi:two-component system response regulator AtoC
MANIKILIVDDDKTICRTLKYQLEKGGYEVFSANSGDECLYLLKQNDFSLVLLDNKLPGMSGIDVLKQIRQSNSDLPVIIVTAYGSIESAVDAMKSGAHEYLTKPINFEMLMIKIENVLEAKNYKREIARLRAEQEGKYSFKRIVCKSQVMNDLISLTDRIAKSDAGIILIQGETGVGKDLLARVLHYESNRREKPFIEVTCTALPITLLESELFGHEKGAFTDAKTKKEGLFELADKGTIFLNEIGHVEIPFQVKILSVLEHKAFRRVGGKEEINIDVRVIAATNVDLKTKVSEGKFREDLYYRLHVLPILIPPLRERREDIMLLAHFFIEQLSFDFRKEITGFSEEAQEYLINYDWPGNVRELKNAIERAVILTNEKTIVPELLSPEIRGQKIEDVTYKLPKEGISLEEIEKQLIKQALEMTGWNQSVAAQILNMGRGALQYRMKKHGFLK